jgi:hypothetical protein
VDDGRRLDGRFGLEAKRETDGLAQNKEVLIIDLIDCLADRDSCLITVFNRL